MLKKLTAKSNLKNNRFLSLIKKAGSNEPAFFYYD